MYQPKHGRRTAAPERPKPVEFTPWYGRDSIHPDEIYVKFADGTEITYGRHTLPPPQLKDNKSRKMVVGYDDRPRKKK